MATVSPSQSDIQVALRSFLLSILPAGVDCIQGQDNRVAEPSEGDFIVMWPIRRERIETNIDGWADVVFTGSIAGTTMTVTGVAYGQIVAGATVFGPTIAASTTVVKQLSGPTGDIGTYQVSVSQTLASGKLASGSLTYTQPTRVVMQLDVHGPNASDNAQMISTLLRDDYAVEAIAAVNPNVAPLYAEDPRQMPFINDQQQYEYRWVVECHLQANQTVTLPQEYADTLVVGLIDVDAVYPAT
jgi:hypothetical protein